MPHQTSQSSAVRAPRKKSTLFCPSCGHESPTDGDWRVRAQSDRVAYDCPVCRDTVTERPQLAEKSPASSVSHTPSAGGSLLARSVRLAFAWTAWPYTPAEYASQHCK